ncbi:unnamed protein product [Lactuca virosa]|uniref:Serine acetyltransferase N-terminal domain-containing protein n=1 Tax=Lactuca virosa TaxID=75947 RepID=A0AAU9P406_9ASTR|nr:unnamed protein product [Lactuca virosa]
MSVQDRNATSQSTMSSSSPQTAINGEENEYDWVWNEIKAEARRDVESEPSLASYLYSTIISHSSLTRSPSFHLGNKLCTSTLLSTLLYDLFLNTFCSDLSLLSATIADLRKCLGQIFFDKDENMKFLKTECCVYFGHRNDYHSDHLFL